jgi:hypothetical protein
VQFSAYSTLDADQVVIAENCDHVYEPPKPSTTPYPFFDGSWGPNEYTRLPFPFDTTSPYLAWIPLHHNDVLASIDIPDSITRLRLSNQVFDQVANRSRLGTLNDAVVDAISQEITFYRNAVEVAYHYQTRFNLDYWHGWPIRAVKPPHNALRVLRFGFLTIKKFQLAYYDMGYLIASLKRMAAEIQGYLLWVESGRTWGWNTPRPKVGYEARGAFANDRNAWDYLSAMGVPVYMVAPTSALDLASAEHRGLIKWFDRLEDRRVDEFLPPEERHWRGFPARYHHTIAHYFYPPHVPTPDVFESVARDINMNRLDEERVHPLMDKRVRKAAHEWREFRNKEETSRLEAENRLRQLGGLRKSLYLISYITASTKVPQQ